MGIIDKRLRDLENNYDEAEASYKWNVKDLVKLDKMKRYSIERRIEKIEKRKRV